MGAACLRNKTEAGLVECPDNTHATRKTSVNRHPTSTVWLHCLTSVKGARGSPHALLSSSLHSISAKPRLRRCVGGARLLALLRRRRGGQQHSRWVHRCWMYGVRNSAKYCGKLTDMPERYGELLAFLSFDASHQPRNRKRKACLGLSDLPARPQQRNKNLPSGGTE